MAVVAHPQRLTALLARLFQWGQGDRVRRFGTRGSGSSDHGRSPAKLFILLLAFLQATPVVKLSFPFRAFFSSTDKTETPRRRSGKNSWFRLLSSPLPV